MLSIVDAISPLFWARNRFPVNVLVATHFLFSYSSSKRTPADNTVVQRSVVLMWVDFVMWGKAAHVRKPAAGIWNGILAFAIQEVTAFLHPYSI